MNTNVSARHPIDGYVPNESDVDDRLPLVTVVVLVASR
jgi:hypothetical protein